MKDKHLRQCRQRRATHDAQKKQLAVIKSDSYPELVQRLVARPPNVVQRGFSPARQLGNQWCETEVSGIRRF